MGIKRKDRAEKQPSLRNKSSRFFLESPSSPLGSIRSLGSLVTTLSGHMKCYCFRCTKKANGCEIIGLNAMNGAISHFCECPIFMNNLEKVAVGKKTNEDVINSILENSLRHLCKYNCYLRAFAPARAWYKLRKSISIFSNASPDKILHGWSCYLDKNSDEDLENARKPTVSFVSPVGEKFCNGDQVLAALGFVGCSTQIFKMTNLTQMPDQRYDRAIAESEIILAFSQSVIECKREILPKTTARRQLFDDKSSKVIMGTAIGDFDNCSKEYNNTSSPFGLLEELFVSDPWRLLISAILLNRTCREQVDLVLLELLRSYPNCMAMSNAKQKNISDIIRPIGMRNRRADTLIRFSTEFMTLMTSKKTRYNDDDNTKKVNAKDCNRNRISGHFSREEVIQLYGIGIYAADVYEIFFMRKYENMCVEDHALQYYIEYQRGITTPKEE
mmetsp:Transcript_16285/g.24448  ORF Transcript_16285/g.24448 Transcript_16285/m.24448 type:complete len:444 (-) Transcript_16285:28-1359(-)